MQLVPQAVANDGLFGLTIAGRISKLGVMLTTPRFYAGTIGEHPQVDLYTTAQVSVEAAGAEPIFVEADGEFLGECPAEFKVLNQAIRVIAPE
jgi:diacylglycerol kinase family enzyme